MSVVSEVKDPVQDEQHAAFPPNFVSELTTAATAAKGRSGGVCLSDTVSPGDMLYVRGTGGMAEIGTAGGFLGHVMLVVAAPQRIAAETPESVLYDNIWPKDAKEIWIVRTVEATRQSTGFHEADMLLYCIPRTRALKLIGEVAPEEGEIFISGEFVELWQSPEELRSQLLRRQGLIEEVLEEMREKETNWSWTTAVRAVTRSSNHQRSFSNQEINRDEYLEEITDCWESDPICTSIIICFWQRCLVKLARQQEEWQHQQEPVHEEQRQPDPNDMCPAELINTWMPLMSDRTLPGNLLDVMKARGWIRRTTMERDSSTRRSLRDIPEDGSSSSPSPVKQPAAVQRTPQPSPERTPQGSPQSSPLCSPCPSGKQAPGGEAPKFCCDHATSSQREKRVQAERACSGCHMVVVTTYAQLAYCARCSRCKDQCMICGATAPQDSDYVPPTKLPEGMPPVMWQSPAVKAVPLSPAPQVRAVRSNGGSPAPVIPTLPSPVVSRQLSSPAPRHFASPSPSVSPSPSASPGPSPCRSPASSTSCMPRFCSQHTREKRVKGALQMRQCGSCLEKAMFGYEIAVCARCSETEEKCLICGTSVPGCGTQGSASAAGSSVATSCGGGAFAMEARGLKSVVLPQAARLPPPEALLPVGPPSTPGSSVEAQPHQQNSAVEEVYQAPDRNLVVRRCSSNDAQAHSVRLPVRSQNSGEVVPPALQQAPTPPPPVFYRRHPKSNASLVKTSLSSGPKATLAPMASGVLLVDKPSKADDKQVAPRYCVKHSTTENRRKIPVRRAKCAGCCVVWDTTYAEFAYCASCTNSEEKCMLCGEEALQAGDYVPAARGTLMPQKLGRTTPYAVRERRLA